jgi:hypothetical protein
MIRNGRLHFREVGAYHHRTPPPEPRRRAPGCAVKAGELGDALRKLFLNESPKDTQASMLFFFRFLLSPIYPVAVSHLGTNFIRLRTFANL